MPSNSYFYSLLLSGACLQSLLSYVVFVMVSSSFSGFVGEKGNVIVMVMCIHPDIKILLLHRDTRYQITDYQASNQQKQAPLHFISL